MNYDVSNEKFRLAIELVNQSSRNIFLTGKAGTGKTTFLKYVRENCAKQMAVVAPTGVAAINAGGVTIHSFFQLPFSPFVPETTGFSKNREEVVNPHSLVSRLRLNKDKIKVLLQLELLIIDEVSMVRCDTMDAIDTVLRFTRKRPHERFGGVQMLFIGDMFQLPPVIKGPEWKMLAEYYTSPYFFDSLVFRGDPPLFIEFDKIYRQSEERFIRLLNQVRNNNLDEEGIKILEDHYHPNFRPSNRDGYIILSTHNEMARSINAEQLGRIDSNSFNYNAEIEDEFAENAYPADEVLQLKVGAQVMFIRNDSDRSKRYFNGKVGIVTKLEEDTVFVRGNDESQEIEVKRERWEHIRYSLNKTSRKVEEEVLGSFRQFPLRLAWAITIHKSQGLTFDKAIIDAGEAFAPGQVYVALSRCTSLDGMVLQSKLRNNSLFTDQRIVEFSQMSSSSDQLLFELAAGRKAYQEKLLFSTFDFRLALSEAKGLLDYATEHRSSFNTEAFSWLEELIDKINTLQVTATKFQSWLRVQFQLPESTEENVQLQERTLGAAAHFVKELSPAIEFIRHSPAITDSRLHAKEYNESLRDVFGELSIKRYLIQGFIGKFNVDEWHNRRKNFVLPPLSINAYAASSNQSKSESPHPLLHLRLRKLRDTICGNRDLPIYMVAGTQTIDELARYLPQTLAEIRMVSGFGEAKTRQYGQQFLDVIAEYCKEHAFSSLIHEKSLKKEKGEGRLKRLIRPVQKKNHFGYSSKGLQFLI